MAAERENAQAELRAVYARLALALEQMAGADPNARPLGRALEALGEAISGEPRDPDTLTGSRSPAIQRRTAARPCDPEDLDRLQAILDTLPGLVLVIGTSGLVEYASRSCQHLTGYTPDELVGRQVPWIHPDDRSRIEDALAQSILDGTVAYDLEFRVVRRDGTLWHALASWQPLRGSDGRPTGLVIGLIDVSSRTQLEERQREAQRMEAMGRLLSGVAHEFNNLLTIINGYSQFALESIAEESDLRGDLDEIRRAGLRASDLTSQLLAFSRRQIMNTRVLDVNEILENMSRMLRRILGNPVELQLHLGEDVEPVRADRGQLEQAVVNLCLNARDAMPVGGELVLETANERFEQVQTFGRYGLSPGYYVRLTVRDTGQGMAPDVQAHLFEPFFTTKPSGRGTGLGLATVADLAKRLGGDVQVTSREGGGTAIVLYLPQSEEAADENGMVLAREMQLPRGDESLLLVEGEDAVRRVAARALRRLGYRVIESRDANEALDATESLSPGAVQMVITDAIHQNITGRALVDRLRPRLGAFRVLYMSGYPRDQLDRAGAMGAHDSLLEKPFTIARLANEVRRALDEPAAMEAGHSGWH